MYVCKFNDFDPDFATELEIRQGGDGNGYILLFPRKPHIPAPESTLVYKKKDFIIYKSPPRQIWNDYEYLDKVQPQCILFHTRRATTKEVILEHTHPPIHNENQRFYILHNGHDTYPTLVKMLAPCGFDTFITSILFNEVACKSLNKALNALLSHHHTFIVFDSFTKFIYFVISPTGDFQHKNGIYASEVHGGKDLYGIYRLNPHTWTFTTIKKIKPHPRIYYYYHPRTDYEVIEEKPIIDDDNGIIID